MNTAHKIYFVSDAHLGFPNHAASLEREKKLVSFLRETAADATEIYLLGDIFDFWFEYSQVVPRNFTRLLGTIAELNDKGIKVHFFIGNHDMWTFGYLEQECGVILHRDRLITEYNGKRFFIAHGDGMGPGDKGYKRLKRVFNSPVMQWLFARFHPNFSFRIARKWSHSSRLNEKAEDMQFKGEDQERLLQYALRKTESEHFDFFIFGHRHVPFYKQIGDKTHFVMLGDWLNHFTYAVFDGNEIHLKEYNK